MLENMILLIITPKTYKGYHDDNLDYFDEKHDIVDNDTCQQ